MAVQVEESWLTQIPVPAGIAGVDGAEVERAGDRRRQAAGGDIHDSLDDRHCPGDGAAEVADPEGRHGVREIDRPAATGQLHGCGDGHGQLRSSLAVFTSWTPTTG